MSDILEQQLPVIFSEINLFMHHLFDDQPLDY